MPIIRIIIFGEIILTLPHGNKANDEADLLTILIERWDDENYPLEKKGPIQLITILMEDWKYTPESLANEIGLCPKKFADIMNTVKALE